MIYDIFLDSLKESIVITAIIFVLMILVELFVLLFKDKIINLMRKKGLSYFLGSFFGSIPGCIGTFAIDSLYMAGLISFGAIMSAMVATFGDEAFLILSLGFTKKISWSIIALLFFILFILGIISGFLADIYQKKLNITLCKKCSIKYHKKKEFKIKHFLKEHVYNHIIKKHLLSIFLWLFIALFIISFIKLFIDASLLFNNKNMLFILFTGALLGLLPISGPNVFLITLFAQGYIPFSILLTNSIIQDGHGLLPILGFDIKDAIHIKLFNFVFGLIIGLILFYLGF